MSAAKHPGRRDFGEPGVELQGVAQVGLAAGAHPDPKFLGHGQDRVVAVGHARSGGTEGDALVLLAPDPAELALGAHPVDRVTGGRRLQGRGHAGDLAAKGWKRVTLRLPRNPDLNRVL